MNLYSPIVFLTQPSLDYFSFGQNNRNTLDTWVEDGLGFCFPVLKIQRIFGSQKKPMIQGSQMY